MKISLNSLKGRFLWICRIVQRFLNTIYELFNSEKDQIIITAWVDCKFGKLKKRNWGDELNIYVIHALTGKRILCRDNVYFNRRLNYCVIGSIADTVTNKESIIWGAGALWGGEHILKEMPRQILAVRGKLTRNYFMSNGVECPEIYGDPALLLPLIYTPSNERKYDVGIIPHSIDIDNEIIHKLKKEYGENVLIIKLSGYNNWTDIIDQINSCKIIVSSSLHGLIVSDAYKIPNVWIKSSKELSGGYFKFYDYFSSIGRLEEVPHIISGKTTLEDIQKWAKNYRPIKFNPKDLLSVCPFQLKPEFYKYMSQ